MKLTEEWLIENHFDNSNEIYSNGGLYLTKFGDDWRWRVGDSDGMWAWLAEPTVETIRTILRFLGK